MNKTPNLMPFQNEPFNGDTFAAQRVLEFKSRYDLRNAVELGTCLGSSTLWLSMNFSNVVTVEINPTFMNIAKVRFEAAGAKNIHALTGDSSKLLRTIMESCTDKTLVFIDSHWEKHTPMPEELQAIKDAGRRPVIMIHDFYNPAHPEFGYDSYMDNGKPVPFNWTWIEQHIHRIYEPEGYRRFYNTEATGAKRGIIYFAPHEQ